MSAAETRIAIATLDGIAIYDLPSGQRGALVKDSRRDFTAHALSGDGQRLATLNRDGTLIFWNADTGREIIHLTVKQHFATVDLVGPHMGFTANDRLLHIRASGGSVLLVAGWGPAPTRTTATASAPTSRPANASPTAFTPPPENQIP
jgi:hypothetical protein